MSQNNVKQNLEQVIELAEKLEAKVDSLDLDNTSSAEIKKFIGEIDELQESLKSIKNPVVKMIGVLMDKIKSDHLQSAYESAQARELNPAQTTADDIAKMLEDFKREMAVLKNKKNPVYGDAQTVVELGEKLAAFADENLKDPLSRSIAQAFKDNKFSALHKMYREEVKVVRNFANGKFDLFEDNFIGNCQEYFEDLALNVSKKSKKYLTEAAQVMKGLPEDFKGLKAENDQEKDFIDNLPGQTTLLLKIIERELKIKNAAKTPVTKKSAVARKSAPKR